jgi:hypothetical protein
MVWSLCTGYPAVSHSDYALSTAFSYLHVLDESVCILFSLLRLGKITGLSSPRRCLTAVIFVHILPIMGIAMCDGLDGA